MKFSDVKYANQFISRGLEIHAITPEQVEEVRECEILVRDKESNDVMDLCSWFDSGVAGEMVRQICHHDENWRATDSPTPCQECEALKEQIDSAKQCCGGFVKEPFDGSLTTAIQAISMRCGMAEARVKELEGILKAHGIETQTEVK